MPQEHQRKPTTKPAAVVTKKAPAPVPKDPGFSPASDQGDAGEQEWVLDAPSKIEIVGDKKGQLASKTLWISARRPLVMVPVADRGFIPEGPRCKVTAVAGNNSIRVRHAPASLPVDGDRLRMNDPAYGIMLDFSPEVDATYRSTLEIQLLDAPGQPFRIPIVAFSDPGQRHVAHAAPQSKAPPQSPPSPTNAPLTTTPAPSTPTKAPPSVQVGWNKTPAPIPAAVRSVQPVKLTRHLGLPLSFDLGEQVIGSNHTFIVANPVVADSGASVRIMPSIQSSGSLSSKAKPDSDNQLIVVADEAIEAENAKAFRPLGYYREKDIKPIHVDAFKVRPIEIEFVPARPGFHQAILRLSLSWSDGEVAEWFIRLSANARRLTDAPKAGLGVRTPQENEPREHQQEEARPPVTPGNAATQFTRVTNDARDSVAGLAGAQERGIILANAEVLSYKETPPETPLWATLAEIAISMGVAGIAGVVAKALSKGLGESVIRLRNLDSTAIKAGDLKIAQGANDAIKEGLKNAAKKVIQMPGRKTGKLGSEKQGVPPQPKSSNVEIAFFANQRTMLGNLVHENRKMITREQERLEPMLTSSPALAVEVMSVLGQALEATRLGQAEEEQALASVTQWVVGVARTDRPRPGGPTFDAVNEDPVDVVRERRTSAILRGLLRLDISIRDNGHGITPSGITVNSAAMKGVSQEIADRLWREPLVGLSLPVLVTARSNNHGGSNARELVGRLTRDEVGRVRIDGEIPGAKKPFEQREPEKIRAATGLIEILFSKSLAEWKVPQIVTDDASGRSSR